MLVAAGLAGGGAYFFAKANIEETDFHRSIQLIAQDHDAGWCDIARGHIVPGSEGSAFCAIHMPHYIEPEPKAE